MNGKPSTTASQHTANEVVGAEIPIAIIGLAFEFAQDAVSEESLWKLLCEGRSTETEFPKDRLNIDAFYHADSSRPSTLSFRGGNFVREDLGAFDAPFFSITPAEAACMDPQHRRMLEISYNALENAGLPFSKCCGSNTSVYTGCFTHDYFNVLQHDHETEQRHAALGVPASMLANRISWFFDFKGPSTNLDSACSSAMMALHLACQDLRTGASSMGLVGGANLIYHPDFSQMLSNSSFISPDSRSWSFDERANGYSRGEGIAVIIVKRLDDAIRDGDTVRAVIRATGSNQDGRTPGITQPSQEAQLQLIKQTFAQANLDMQPTRFFEAHGTGTKIGDPTEAQAIGRAFSAYRSTGDPLHIGAIKSNLGHLEGGSGLAGLIKTVLVLEKGIIPPIAGLKTLNRRIDAKHLHLNFPNEAVLWPTTGLRRACVNSFGFGGSNSVVILDDTFHYLQSHALLGNHYTVIHPCMNDIHVNGDISFNKDLQSTKYNGSADMASNATDLPVLLVSSANDQESAARMAENISQYMLSHRDCGTDMALALAQRRNHFPWRSFQIWNPYRQSGSLEKHPSIPIKSTNNNASAWIFTGQGAQFKGMSHGLRSFPVFQETLNKIAYDLRKIGCQWSLDEVMEPETKYDIDRPEYSQTVTTCLQIALVDLLKSFGITPSVVFGHSSGEIAAAYAMGALSRFSAVKVAYWRGIMSSCVAAKETGLGMMAVGLSRTDVLSYLEKLECMEGVLEVAIGCVNSPKNVTLTGKSSQLSILETWFQEESIFARRLRVTVAYHSSFMQNISADYQISMGQLECGIVPSPRITMISSVSGLKVEAQQLCLAEYWVRNMVSPVDFAKAFDTFISLPNSRPRKQLGRKNNEFSTIGSVLEIGPHGALQGPIRECLKAASAGVRLRYIPSQTRGSPASTTLLEAVGMLYSTGHAISLLAVNRIQDVSRPLPESMPLYPFNHKQSYWKESRFSRNFRFRKVARHELLGTQCLDWNNQAAQWRNVIRLQELPWLEDHKINGQIIFPAAGMIVMAIEALKQVMPTTIPLSAVKFRDVKFKHPMRTSRETNSLEAQFNLSLPSSVPKPEEWSSFRLFCIEQDEYIECCQGLISPIVDEKEKSRILHDLSFLNSFSPLEWLESVSQKVDEQILDPYARQDSAGVQYGPKFQTMRQMRLGSHGEATAAIDLDLLRSSSNSSSGHNLSIHPTTLDGLAQLIVPSLTENRQNTLPAMVPAYISSMLISLSFDEILSKEGLIAAASCHLRSKRGAMANILAISAQSKDPIIFFEGLKTSFIETEPRSPNSPNLMTRHLCTQFKWKPDISLMSNTEIRNYCLRDRPDHDEHAMENYRAVDLVIMVSIEIALDYLNKGGVICADRHLAAYIDWMRYQKQRLVSGALKMDTEALDVLLKSSQARDDLFRRVKETGGEGAFFVHVGQNLMKVLEGDMDPLELMFQDGAVDRYYQEVLVQHHRIQPALAYLDLLAFRNPSMRILEIGAGTGGQTLRMMESLASDGAIKWAQYDYTDISSSFFERARSRLEMYSGTVNFKVCDISQDVVAQSFEPGSYDLIIAAHVLHATGSVKDALANVKRLLKPDGKFLLSESTRPESLRIGFAFGLLSSWWNAMEYEPRSHLSPCITTADWHQQLQAAGLTGVDMEFPDSEDPDCHYSSIIVSRSNPPALESSKNMSSFALVVDGDVQIQLEVAACFESQYPKCVRYNLAEFLTMQIPSSTTLVFLLEMNARFLDGISETDFKTLQSILSRHKTTIWVTSTERNSSDPSHCLVHGFGRSLCSEDASRKFVTINLDKVKYTSPQIVENIATVVRHTDCVPIEYVENDYIATSDGLEIGRISKYQNMNVQIAQAISDYRLEQLEIGPNTHLSIRHTSSGAGHHIELHREDSVSAAPCADEVVVEVKTLGLTHRDVLVLAGEVDQLHLFSELAGTIHMAGEQSGFHVGDRVCSLTAAESQTHLRVKAESVVPIPDSMSFNDITSMLSAIWLSYHVLINTGQVKTGDYVLIHRASSSFGQVAIQLAQKLGARVLLTTSSNEKRANLCERLGLSTNDIFDSADPLLMSRIKQICGGKGANIIVGALGLNPEIDFARCATYGGHIIDLSLFTPVELNAKSSSRSRGNVSRTSVDMMEWFRHSPDQACETLRNAIGIAVKLNIQSPQPVHVFELDSIEDALSHVRDPKVDGKRMVAISTGTKVMAHTKTKPSYSFDPEATYIIAGGLGGLGRVIARWMVHRGARYLVLLSRSGVRTQAARDLVESLRNETATCITPSVDVSNKGDLQKTISQLAKTMPPIKGCIQATVALRDNLFENMSHEDWSVSTSSKVTGSWNLHEVLPADLDFFVLLSSIGGVYGARAQTNYAAGNTYKDALAKYRVSQGLKAVSIDLGFMIDEGVVAENDFLLNSMKRIGLLMEIKTPEMLALLDYYCDARLPLLSESEAQILTGLELPSVVKANGFDLHHALSRPMASHLFHMKPDQSTITSDNSDGMGQSTVDYASRLAETSSEAEANDVMFEWLLWKIGLMLGLSVAEIDPSKPLHAYGIDSLIAIDLKNWFRKQVGVDIPVFELLGNTPLSGISLLAISMRNKSPPV